MNITPFQVLEKYFGVSKESFTAGKGRWSGACPFHNETNGESLIIYEKQGKFDWVCMGKCHTGGEAPHMLVHGGVCTSISDAVRKLREDFNIKLPDKVTLENYAEIKNISVDTLKQNGIYTHEFYHDGEEATGLAFPLKDALGNTRALKVRTKWEGKRRFFYLEGDWRWFGLHNLPFFNTDEPLFLCEGESDTLSLLDAGLQAVGFLGSTGFSADVAELKAFNKLVLCADNDEAGKSLLKEAQQHYPSTLYTVNLGKYNDINEFLQYNKVEALKWFPAVPALVSAEWYDCADMWRTLLAGRSQLEAMAITEQLKRAKHPAKVVNTALKLYWSSPRPQQEDGDDDSFSGALYAKGGCYCRQRVVGGEVREEAVSNFTLRVRQTILTDDGVVRVCNLISQQGTESQPVYLTGDVLANVPAFRAVVISAGNYNWRGSAEDLACLIDLLQSQSTNIIKAPTICGRHKDIWLMGRHGVDSTGQVIPADPDGVISLDGEQFIMRNINTSDEEDDTSYPVLPTGTDFDRAELKDVADTLKRNLGGYEAYMALGFCVAGWHSDELYRMNGEHNFPIFFVAGKRNSGKSVLANWLMSSYGFANDSMGKNWALPSPVSITRKLGYYSSLPQWYDDYRNGLRDADRRNQLLLSAYNRQGGDKGTRTGFGVRSEPVRSTLLLSGEDVPYDNAVLSRCCVIQVSANKRDDSLKEQVFRVADRLPAMGMFFLQDKQTRGSQTLVEQVTALQHRLESYGIDSRLAKNKAIFAGAFLYHWGSVIEDTEEFLAWLRTDVIDTFYETAESHAVGRFMDDVGAMIINGEIKSGVEFRYNGELEIRYNLLFDAWSRRTNRPDITKQTLLNYLKLEPSVTGFNRTSRFNGSVVKVLSIDIKKQPSELLREAVEQETEEI